MYAIFLHIWKLRRNGHIAIPEIVKCVNQRRFMYSPMKNICRGGFECEHVDISKANRQDPHRHLKTGESLKNFLQLVTAIPTMSVLSLLRLIVANTVHADAASFPRNFSSPPSVAINSTFDVTRVPGIVYGQGLIFVGTRKQSVVNLTLDAFVPVAREDGVPVPRSPRPAIMFVHGGGFSGSILDPDKAAHLTPDVQYFVQRGFVGFQLNYRLSEDEGSFPTAWPDFPRTGGAGLGVQPPIAAGASLFESQQFRLHSEDNSGGKLLSLASDSELCVHAQAFGGSVSMRPCPKANANATNNTDHWRVSGESIIGVGGVFDGKCLGTTAPRTDKRAFVAKIAFRCKDSDPSQKWKTTDLESKAGGTICHPHSSRRRPVVAAEHPPGASEGAGAGSGPVDVGCLSFAGGFNPPVSHLYPAVRDVKAAVRWLRADSVKSAPRFNVDPRYITLDGGSAGACTILGAGLAQVPGDFTTEISLADDPTLATTNLAQSSSVRSMVVHWGAPFAVDIATTADPLHRSRYLPHPLPSIIAFNGLIDTTVPIEHIREVQRAYQAANATIVVRPLPNQPHACWDANVTVGGRQVTQPEDAFAFIRSDQRLGVIGG